MHEPSRSSLYIGISRAGITVVRMSGWFRRQAELVCDHSYSTPFAEAHQAAALLDDVLTEQTRFRLPTFVTLSDDCVRLFMVTPPRNSTNLQDCRAAADMRFQSLYGEAAGDWNITADWDLRKPFLACALPLSVLDTIVRAVDKHKLSLMELVPHFVSAWNRWANVLKQDAWFAVVHENNLTLASIEGRRLCTIRSISLPHDAEHPLLWVTDQVRREALRQNLSMPRRIQFCGALIGAMPSNSEGQLEFERLDIAQHAPDSMLQCAGVDLACAGVRQ